MSENYWRINPQVTKNSLFMATHVLFHFLHAFLLLNHRQTDENSHWSIAVPLLFTVGHSVAVLWCHTSTYCDVILSNCPQNISKWVTYIFPPSSSSTKLKGGILVSPCPSVCPSVCGQNHVCSVSSTILVGSISYLHILSSNFRRCVMCKLCFKTVNVYILANSLNL